MQTRDAGTESKRAEPARAEPLDFIDLRFIESYAAATVSIGNLLSTRSLLTSTDAPHLGFEFQNG